MRRAFAVAILAVVLTGTTAAAAAEKEKEREVETARRLFDAGAQAYAAGQFATAIQAFEQANRVVPNPAILFSLAQSQRRQYIIDKNPQHLRNAIKNFHAYLKQMPEGGRRVDAVAALADLEVIESRLGDSGASAPSLAKEGPTRLFVTSTTPGAVVSIDGKPPRAAPLSIEVAPGKHMVRVTAPGYFPAEQPADALDAVVIPVPMNLREMPARLVVRAPSGADVYVDGTRVGEVGKSGAIDVPAGTRYVSVLQSGRTPFSQELELKRGQEREVVAPLRVTQQRIVAYGLVGIAGVSAVVSGVIGVGALGHQERAREIYDQTATRNLSLAEKKEYDREVHDRDLAFRQALIGFGFAAGVGAVGGLLWVFDKPSIPATPTRERDTAPEPVVREPTEIGLGPGPGIGASLNGRF